MPDQVSAKSFNKVFEHGIFENQSEKGFQEGYFYRTNEIVRFFESMGFSTLDVVAVQGLGAGREKDIYKIMDTNPELYEEIMRAIVKSSRDKAVVEFGGHCIYTGRKAKHKQWE
ncbi:MAG: hypothetical protein GY866_36270 [Proteobacteria bacterium]|nr:hypothetical protein [Pseudomonadota bacterium]